jgi:cephalosporin-C deacetylase-like acetyl esterase
MKPQSLFLLLLWLVIPPLASAQTLPELQRLFAYDQTAPLDVRQHILEKDESAEVYDLTFASPKGGRVPAFLVVSVVKPKQKYAGIVFGHWGLGNRTEFLAEAKRYARAGVVSIIIDYPWTRPTQWRHPVFTPQTTSERDRDTYIQAVIDLRRAFDLLLSRRDVDPHRIAYIGHSYGAQWGAILTAVDRRMQTTVLMAGVPSIASIYRDSNDPAIVELRQQVGSEALEAHLKIVGTLDAINYIKYSSPIPVLFQFARYERNFDQQAMRSYYEAAGKPKEVRWYSTGHELNDLAALKDRAQWLAKELKLSYKAIVE